MNEVDSTDNLIKYNADRGHKKSGLFKIEMDFPVIFTCDDEETRKRINAAIILQDLVKTKIKKLDEIGTELFNEGHHDKDIDYLESELEELVRKSEQ